MLAFLVFAAILSLADRQILSLLVGPLRQSLGLTDIQIALLQGIAFTLFYAFAALPMGWLVDHGNRRNLLVLAISVWSIATFACAFAGSFAWLFVCRLFVGLAESVLSPAAISLIADYFPPAQRGRAVSIFLAGGLAGGGLAMIGGGVLIFAVRDLPPVLVWGHEIAAWGAVFAMLGGTGLIFGPLGLLLPEPRRRETGETAAGSMSSGGTVSDAGLFDFLRKRSRWWMPHFAGMAMQTVIFYAVLSWVPAFLIRTHGQTPTTAALLYGTSLAIAAPIGAVFAGRVADRWRRKGHDAPALRVAIFGVAAGAVFNILACLSPTLPIAMTGFSLGAFWLAVPAAVSAAAVQEATPNQLRGQVSALYFFTTTLVGLSVGPLAVASLTDRWFESPAMTGAAIATVIGFTAPLALIGLVRARKAFVAPERTQS
jgi:MFS family permease